MSEEIKGCGSDVDAWYNSVDIQFSVKGSLFFIFYFLRKRALCFCYQQVEERNIHMSRRQLRGVRIHTCIIYKYLYKLTYIYIYAA